MSGFFKITVLNIISLVFDIFVRERDWTNIIDFSKISRIHQKTMHYNL